MNIYAPASAPATTRTTPAGTDFLADANTTVAERPRSRAELLGAAAVFGVFLVAALLA